MTADMDKPINIFRAGRHVSLEGEELSFSEQDLAASAKAYDPAKHEAPLVVGHPRLDAPAYGWVKALSFAQGDLDAIPNQVDADFAELIKQGKFKHVSASFYLPDAKQNPVPGVFYLRHVGFLGAAAPAVKGLRPVSFGESEEGVVEFSSEGRLTAGILRSLREWIISKFGLKDADEAVPGWLVDQVGETDGPKFADNPAGSPANEEDLMDQQEMERLKKENEALRKEKAEFAEGEKKRKEEEVKARSKSHADFAESLVKEGRLLPVDVQTVVAALDQLAATDVAVSFGEGDKQEKKPLAEAYKDMLRKAPKVVEFSEIAVGGIEPDTASFATAPGYAVDAEQLEIHNKALALQAKNPNLDYVAAVKAAGGK